MTLAQAQRAVHVGMRDRAARVGLERERGELPPPAERRELRLQAVGLVAAREGRVEAVGALEDRLRPGEPRARHHRRGHPRVRGPARVQALGPGAVGQVLDDPGGLAAAEAEGVDLLVLGEPVEASGHRGGREAPGERGRVVVARVETARHREADPAHHLHPRDHRLEDLAARGPHRLANRQRGGDRDAAGVNDGVLAGVVEVEAVSERAVGEHRARGAHAGRGPHQGALRGAAQLLGGPRDRAAEVLAARGQAAPQRVQGQE